MAECFMLKPLFPGNNETDQIYKTCAVLGSPSQAQWPDGYKLAARMGFSFPKFVPTPLNQLIPNASEQAIDLMMRMLTFDPQKRITASAALKHSFFDGFDMNQHSFNGGISSTNVPTNNIFGSGNPLGSGGKLPGSRAMKIESRKGILSRKSSVNKNSFYKQKTKEAIPNKMYGGGGSYFNKAGAS